MRDEDDEPREPNRLPRKRDPASAMTAVYLLTFGFIVVAVIVGYGVLRW